MTKEAIYVKSMKISAITHEKLMQSKLTGKTIDDRITSLLEFVDWVNEHQKELIEDVILNNKRIKKLGELNGK